MGEVGEISVPLVEALPTTEPLKYICYGPSTAAAEHGILIKR